MKAKLIWASVVLAVVAIGWGLLDIFLSTGTSHRKIAEYTGYSTICVEGVKYIQFVSGASVQYDASGKVVTCR